MSDFREFISQESFIMNNEVYPDNKQTTASGPNYQKRIKDMLLVNDFKMPSDKLFTFTCHVNCSLSLNSASIEAPCEKRTKHLGHLSLK